MATEYRTGWPCPRCRGPIYRVVMGPGRVQMTCEGCRVTWGLLEFGRLLAASLDRDVPRLEGDASTQNLEPAVPQECDTEAGPRLRAQGEGRGGDER